ncbi:MAG: hypothetical protein ABIH35_04165 [Patescibacteria group bacterium]
MSLVKIKNQNQTASVASLKQQIAETKKGVKLVRETNQALLKIAEEDEREGEAAALQGLEKEMNQ